MKSFRLLAACAAAVSILAGCASTQPSVPAQGAQSSSVSVPSEEHERLLWFTGAVERNRPDVVRKMLAEGFDPNVLTENGDPVLVRAIRYEYWNVAKLLLDSPKIRIDMASDVGETALMLACFKGNMPMVEELLARGASVNRIGGWTPLHYAASTGQVEIVRQLLKKGARVNVQTASGVTPLYMAARLPSRQVVVDLLRAGARRDLCNDHGQSPSDAAAKAGDEELGKYLKISACAKPQNIYAPVPSAHEGL